MAGGMRIWISTILAAVLSGLYWLLYLFFFEGFTASDYRSDMQPGETYLMFKVVAAVVIGPLAYALLIVLWRRLERAFVGRP